QAFQAWSCGRSTFSLENADQWNRALRRNLIEDDVRRVCRDYSKIRARSREFTDCLKQKLTHTAEVVCVHEVQSPSEIDANDDKLWIMPVAGAFAEKCDYPLVIVQCAFRSKPADDPKRFHLLTTNLPSYDATCRGSSYFYRQLAVLNSHGSVRKTKRAKHRCSPAQNPAPVAVCGPANPARASGAEARGSRRASRHKEGCTATFEGAIAARTRREGLRILHNNRCSRFAACHAGVERRRVRTASPIGRQLQANR